jgi:S1-C subfamily serine protease
VESGGRIALRTKTGVVRASLVRVDRANDLVLLKAEGQYTALPLSAGPALSLGAIVFTVGFPNPEVQGLEAKLTRGEISSVAGVATTPAITRLACRFNRATLEVR